MQQVAQVRVVGRAYFRILNAFEPNVQWKLDIWDCKSTYMGQSSNRIQFETRWNALNAFQNAFMNEMRWNALKGVETRWTRFNAFQRIYERNALKSVESQNRCKHYFW